MDSYHELKTLVASMEHDAGKFHHSKVKASATRYRALLMKCKKACDAIRREVQAEVKGMTVKKRQTKAKPKEVDLSASVISTEAKPSQPVLTPIKGGKKPLTADSVKLTPKPM